MTYIIESSFYEQYLPRRYFASIMYRLEVIWHQSWQCIKKCNIFGLLGQLHGATPQALVTGNINLTDIVCSLSWTVKNYKVSKSAMLEKCNILALWGWPKGIIAPRLIYFSKALVELMLSSNWHVGLPIRHDLPFSIYSWSNGKNRCMGGQKHGPPGSHFRPRIRRPLKISPPKGEKRCQGHTLISSPAPRYNVPGQKINISQQMTYQTNRILALRLSDKNSKYLAFLGSLLGATATHYTFSERLFQHLPRCYSLPPSWTVTEL